MQLIGLDFETYSAADLPKVGLHNYVKDETFRPLLAAVAWQGTTTAMLIDFVDNYRNGLNVLGDVIGSNTIVAHNAGFEQAVLRRMGFDLPSSRFIDSAVLARAQGYGSALNAAAPQILGIDKMEEGFDLIKLFSMPNDLGNGRFFNLRFPATYIDEWKQFGEYCLLDAELSLGIAEILLKDTPLLELDYAALTLDMNNEGWPVDVDLVQEMYLRYEDNILRAEKNFRLRTGDDELNLNSHPQLVAWCGKRGVRSKSFDEKAVRRLISRLEKKLHAMPAGGAQRKGYIEVLDLLTTKQALGGSSLKKLTTILSSVGGDDDRLYDQYLHCGAGATLRTTGRSVQMQNLKRLGGDGDCMEDLKDPAVQWDNAKLARNLRQVFTASHPQGVLIVGDFASVESRGLAWQAGEQWKLDAYHHGDDLYKVLAGKIFGKYPNDVDKGERQVGKTGELACGYGAGPEAVRAFAEGMGIEMSEGESVKLVKDWRTACPKTVDYWQLLDIALRNTVGLGRPHQVVMPRMTVSLQPFAAPRSLRQQTGDPDLMSLRFSMSEGGAVLFTRVIHGVHEHGRSIRYWKPSDRKTGDLWNDRFTDPKTGLVKYYSVYGGKLAGLLTQSLCRELFFMVLMCVHRMVDAHPNLRLVGQFHDEIVLEWSPAVSGVTQEVAMDWLHQLMSGTALPGFPLDAQVKADHRYTK